jgi:hypothetical protein
MMTFTEHMTASRRNPAPRRTADMRPVLRATLEHLTAAKLIPASLLEQSPDSEPPAMSEIAIRLSRNLMDCHNMIVSDPSANVLVKRLSYENLCLHFLVLIAVAGSDFEEEQE